MLRGAPLPVPCSISDISISNISVCDNNSTTTDSFDDTFMADITITFSDIPSTGNLDISGDGSASVSVGGLDSSTAHTFSNIMMSADGMPINITATFSDDSSCTLNNPNVATAPESCSCISGVNGPNFL